MPYSSSFQDLITVLRSRVPNTANAISKRHRIIEHGLLPVGLKIHCLKNRSVFTELVHELGGPDKALHQNVYRAENAALCLVLPPVGSASTAIMLIECIEEFIKHPLFDTDDVQIQVCTAKRLKLQHGALVAIGFYLGSDTLREYSLDEFRTTASENKHRDFNYGSRLVIYDAQGDFDPYFEWWGPTGSTRRSLFSRIRSLREWNSQKPRLPFCDRTDLLLGRTSRRDIMNVNLLASLMVHVEAYGHWHHVGRSLQEAMHAMLRDHHLIHLVQAPWIAAPAEGTRRDDEFFSALQELMAYALDERERIDVQLKKRLVPEEGILNEMESILNRFHDHVRGNKG